MFKKRGRPEAARSRGDEQANDGDIGTVPVAVDAKKAKMGAAAANSSESGRIGASTRRSDADRAAAVAGRDADTVISGLKASDIRGPTPADDITRTLEIDTEISKDTRAMHERNLEIHKGLKDGTLEKGVYRGAGGYKRYLDPSEGAISASKFTGALGPMRNSLANVRTTIRTDYWNASSGTDGGICKDYKETGYCGYGDTCIYLHDRSDYKSGFQLDREWEARQQAAEEKKRRKWEKRMQRAQAGGDDGSDSSRDDGDEDNDLPMSCPVCGLPWEDCKSVPVKTICSHYFCEDCAMEGFARTPKCLACDAPTVGIFNTCDALEEKVRKKKAAKQAKGIGSAGVGSGGDGDDSAGPVTSSTSGVGASVGPFNIGME